MMIMPTNEASRLDRFTRCRQLQPRCFEIVRRVDVTPIQGAGILRQPCPAFRFHNFHWRELESCSHAIHFFGHINRKNVFAVAIPASHCALPNIHEVQALRSGDFENIGAKVAPEHAQFGADLAFRQALQQVGSSSVLEGKIRLVHEVRLIWRRCERYPQDRGFPPSAN